MQPAGSQVSRLDVAQLPPLPAGGALPGQYVVMSTCETGGLTGELTGVCLMFGQVYFSSLPLGIYLLMIGQLWLGVVLVSLVPSTLLLLVLYGFCQCLCHELREALATRTLP